MVWRAQFCAVEREGKGREGKGKAHLVAKRRRRRGSTKREAAVAESSPRGKETPEVGEVNGHLLALGKLKRRSFLLDRLGMRPNQSGSEWPGMKTAQQKGSFLPLSCSPAHFGYHLFGSVRFAS